MKILHVFLNHGGRTETWSFNLLKALARTGVKNSIASVNFQETDFVDLDFKYYKYPLHSFGKNRVTRALNKLFYNKWLASKLKKGDYDVVHAHFGKTGWRYIDLVKTIDAPLVVSFYGKDYECIPFRKPIWKERYQELFKEASKFVCEGNNGIKILSGMGCLPEKCGVVHLGIIPENIPFHKRAKKSGELKMLQMASFVEKKGHIYTVKAVEKALKNCPNLSLTFVGGKYDAFEEVNNYIKEAGLEKQITILDFVDYRKLNEFFKDFQVFIHPSVYAADMDCEGGAPVVLLDAQATGMPIISSYHCDIPEEVIHGKTGLLAEEKDVDMLAEHITRFYDMRADEYAGFAKSAQEHVAQNYDIDKSIQNLISIYESQKKR